MFSKRKKGSFKLLSINKIEMQLNICAPCSLYVNGYWEEKYYLEYYLCLVFSFILQLGATWNLKNGLDLFFCCQWYFLEVCYSFHIIKEITKLPLVECYNPLSLQLNCNTNKIRLYKIIQNSSQQAIEFEISRKSFYMRDLLCVWLHVFFGF